MLCPDICNFPPPKIMSSHKKNEKFETLVDTIKRNSFYKSVIVSCPDAVRMPPPIEDVMTEDNDYYRISNCPLTEFIEATFVEKFVQYGHLYCLSVDRNCIVQNSAAITPDGILTLHILESVFQMLALDGTKRPNKFYEVKIDLKMIKHYNKLKCALNKLETFDFYITWEPHNDSICPSSIAKYLCDRDISVSVSSLHIRTFRPFVDEIPSVKDTDIEDMVEWVGLVAHEANLSPTMSYISTYSQPTSIHSMESNVITVLIAKGFITPTIIHKLCNEVSNFVISKDLDNYWASISVQSCEDSLWQWSANSQKMFQAHDHSCNIFVSKEGINVYSVGQLKYS